MTERLILAGVVGSLFLTLPIACGPAPTRHTASSDAATPAPTVALLVAHARSLGSYCRNSIGECTPNIFGGECPSSHPHGSDVPCPAATAGPTLTPTTGPTAIPTGAPLGTAVPTPIGGWTYVAIGRPPQSHYAQGPSAACSGSWATDQRGDCYLAFDWGWFPYPDPDGTGFEEVGVVRYPYGEPARYEAIERGATGAQGKGTHECPYPTLLFDRTMLRVMYARTTYESLGCDGCRIRGTLAWWDGQRWTRLSDWLGPVRPDATFRCCDKPPESGFALRAAPVEVAGHGRTMKPPVEATWDSARSISEFGVSSRAAPAWSGNVGWSTALFSDGSVTYLVAYDGSVSGGPWVLYYVESDWSGVRLLYPMIVPSDVVWIDDCGWGPTPRRLICLATTKYGAYANQTAVSEIESTDGGVTWRPTGRTWSPPGGLRAFEAGYLRRLEDGGVWEDAVFLTVGDGGGPANAEGDWKLAIMYRPGTAAPVSRFLELLPGWQR